MKAIAFYMLVIKTVKPHPFETYYGEHMREGSRQAYLWSRLKIQEHRHSGRQRKEGACCTHLPLLMRGLFLRHTQHNAHTMQRENKRHRSHISDGWWTKFSTCQTCYIWSAHGKMGLSPLCSSDAPLSPNKHIYTHIYHYKLTLVYGTNVAWEYEHSSMVRWSEEGEGLP